MRGLRGRELPAGVAVGLLAAGLTLWLGGGAGPEARVPGARPGRGLDAGRRSLGTIVTCDFTPPGLAALPGMPPNPTMPLTRSTHSVRGQVWPRDGSSPAGFRIRVQGMSGTTAAASDGTFRLAAVSEGVHFIEAFRPDGAWGSRRVAVEGPEATADIVALQGSGSVQGVVLAGVETLAGAWVGFAVASATSPGAGESVTPRLAETAADAGGRFEIRGLPAGTYLVFGAADGGLRSALERVALADGGRADLTLSLDEGVAISGRVVDGRRAPVAASIVVSCDDPLEDLRCRGTPCDSGADGTFRVEGLRRGTTYVLAAYPPSRYGSASRRVQAPAEGAEIDVPERAIIRLDLRDDEGRPVEDATVIAEPEGAPRYFYYFLDRSAGYALCFDEDSSCRIHASSPGLLVAESPPVAARRGEETRLTLTLSRGQAVRGTVTDSSGAPVRGAIVGVCDIPEDGFDARATVRDFDALVGDGRDPRRWPGWWRAAVRVGRDGRFEIGGLEPGRYLVVAGGEGYLPVTQDVSLGATDPPHLVDFRLMASAQLSGVVVDPLGEPVPFAEVTICGAAGPEDVHTEADGHFTVEGLYAGSYEASASGRGFSPVPPRRIEIAEGDDAWIEIGVVPVVPTVRVAVDGLLLLDGRPVAGGRVRVAPEMERGVPLEALAARIQGADADQNGRFALDVGSGPRTLWVSWGTADTTCRVDVPPAPTWNLVIELGASAIEGVVIDAETGSGIEGAGVVALGTDDGTASCVTGPRGEFTLYLPPGVYAVGASWADRTAWTRAVNVEPGGRTRGVRLVAERPTR